MGAEIGRIVNDYQGLMEIFRQRAEELEISRSSIDELSGLANGFAGKALGNQQRKKMGPVSLGPMLQVLGLKMLIIEDEAATARTLALRTPVQSNQQRFGNVSRLTPKLLVPPTAPPVGPPALSIVHGSQKRGGKYA
jgi:hypothetical protein